MNAPAVLCPRCGSHLSSLASGTICLSCLSRRLLDREQDGATSEFTPLRAVSTTPLPAAVAVPDQLGAYEILEELGRGGMGIVYSARHKDLDRVVALKVIRRGEWATAEDEARFLREAQAAAKLSHPGIVTIFDVGRHHTWSFYAMEYLEGGDLAQLVARGPVTVRSAAGIIAGVAGAVAHAHAHGIVHRDLKPSNILLDESGAPHVADFGLARWTQEAAELTRTGMILGSPAYMAPEQAAGAATAASDVYGLGAMLYFLLTGLPPHSGNAAEVLARASQDDAPPPSRQRAEVPPELDAICRRALARDPAQRYAEAAALGDDLRAWLEGRAVSAPLTGPAEARRLLARAKERLRLEGIEHWNHEALVNDLASATQQDPALVEGWALQARTHCTIVDFHIDASETRRGLARAALARAQALAPGDAATRSAAGAVAVSIDGDVASGLKLYRELAAEFPDDYEMLFRCGRLARRAGLWREGNRLMAEAVRKKSDNSYDRAVTAFGFYAVRDFPNAVALIDEAVRIDASDYQRRCFQIWFRWQRDPLPSRALQEIRALPAEMRKLRDVAWIECQFLFAESRFAEALAAYRAATETSSEHAIQVMHERTFELRLARLANDPSAPAVEAAVRAWLAPGRLPTDLSVQQHALLAHTHAVLGDAAAYRRRADPLLAKADPATLDGARRLGHNEFFAAPGQVLNLALLGDTEGALAAIARQLNVPGSIDVRTLAFEPAFAAVRADPRFEALVAQAQFPLVEQDRPEALATVAIALPSLIAPAETEARELTEKARQRILDEGIQPTNRDAITDLVTRATQLCPTLASAWGVLSRVHLAIWGSGGDPSEARRELGIAALQRGESLDPRNPDVRSARAGHLSQVERKRTEAVAIYRAIAREHPESVFHQMAHARACWAIGHWRTGNAALLQCTRLQPDVGQHFQLVGYGCAVVRDFRNALTWLENACRLDPKPLWRRLTRAWYRWQYDPVPEPLLEQYEEWFTPEERKTDVVAWFAAQMHLARGDPAAARAAFPAEDPRRNESSDLGAELALRYRLERLANLPSATATADKLRALLEPGRVSALRNPQRFIQLGLMHAVLGHREETLAHLAAAIELCPADEYSLRPRIHGHNEFAVPCGQLMLLALIGENERCLDELDRWINVPFAVDLRSLTFDPAFAAIRTHPRFAPIMARAQMPIEYVEPEDGSPPVFPR